MASIPPTLPAPASHPLTGMTRLSDQVWFRDAPTVQDPAAGKSTSASSVPPPQLIILASWMGARDAHIAKYTTHYQTLYPASSLLLIKFIPAQMLSVSRANKAVAPAITYINSKINSGLISPYGSEQQQQQQPQQQPSPPPQILIHLFSNGGSTTLQNLHATWNHQIPTSSTSLSSSSSSSSFPPHTTIYDSTPGLPSLSRTYAAFSISLLPKSTILRLIFSPILYLACVSSFIYVRFILRYFLIPLNLAREDALTRNFRDLNDSPAFVGIERSRTYIYSKEDEMIGWRDVERHAGEAAKRGTTHTSTTESGSHGRTAEIRSDGARNETTRSIPCQLEMFHGSGHVAHMRHDPGRYWKIVVDTWERGFQ